MAEDKGYYQKKGKGPGEQGFGLVHVYFGQGVGKTSRVVGLAVRAAARGKRVEFVQFMKSGDSGEVAAFEKFPNIAYFCPGPHPFISPAGPGQNHLDHAAGALKRAMGAVDRGAQVLICDEILNTLVFKVLSVGQVLELAEACRGKCELVMTGMDAPPELIEAADYATEFKQVKHPYNRGVEAREAIEF